MRKLFVCFLMLPLFHFQIRADTAKYEIKVHFLYGSKPGKKYKKTESKWFGGIHGGHVYIQVDSLVYSFYPKGKFHVFAHNEERHSKWVIDQLDDWARHDTPSCQVTSVTILTDSLHKSELLRIFTSYTKQTPYDYAFFGHRCASAAYDALSLAGILEPYSGFWNITRHFYPKPLRTKMVMLAKENGTRIAFKKGKATRKWEKDKKKVKKILAES